MPCVVGITTNEGRRKAEWKSKYPNLTNWEVIGRHSNRKDAQRNEDAAKVLLGCEGAPGGREPEIALEWVVYKFNY